MRIATSFLILVFVFSFDTAVGQNETIKIRKNDTLCKGNLHTSDTSLFRYPIRVGKIIVEGVSSQKSQKKIKKNFQVHTNELISIGQIKVNAINVCHYEKFTLDAVRVSRGKKNTTNIILHYVKAN